jgi:hypothetical protein
MYLLKMVQDEETTNLGLFESLEDGREFLSQIKAYEIKKEDGFCYEYINPKKLPDFLDLKYKGNIVPLTKFSFDPDKEIEIFRQKLANLSQKDGGLVEGATKVDAYMVENKDLKSYIEIREKNFKLAKKIPGGEKLPGRKRLPRFRRWRGYHI